MNNCGPIITGYNTAGLPIYGWRCECGTTYCLKSQVNAVVRVKRDLSDFPNQYADITKEDIKEISAIIYKNL